MLIVRHLRENIPSEIGMFCFPNPSQLGCLSACYMFAHLVSAGIQLVG